LLSDALYIAPIGVDPRNFYKREIMLLPEPEAEETVLTNIPKGHVNARTKYKTPYVFEIIERNGNIHTFCSAESKRRRMWLRFIDAKARPLDLMDLKLAYLDSGDGGKYFKSERERASRIWKAL
jgi:hypothetical protein